MSGCCERKPWFMLCAGLGLGLLVGVGMLVGALAANRQAARGSGSALPETLLHAMSTHGADNFAIATGPVEDDMEGLFTLDFLTGDLRCYVLNPRTGVWGAGYRYNVVQDLAVAQGKAPKFLMVTGVASFRGGGVANNLGSSMVYVADANTGNFAVYGVPYDRTAAGRGGVQVFPLVRVAVGKAREDVGQ